jgi:hypothetical protein
MRTTQTSFEVQAEGLTVVRYIPPDRMEARSEASSLHRTPHLSDVPSVVHERLIPTLGTKSELDVTP